MQSTLNSFVRSVFQIHVNTENIDPYNVNRADPVSGYSAVPRNMTGLGEVMKDLGYITHFYGKWDAGSKFSVASVCYT